MNCQNIPLAEYVYFIAALPHPMASLLLVIWQSAIVYYAQNMWETRRSHRISNILQQKRVKSSVTEEEYIIDINS